MDEDETEVTLELADENHSDTEQAAEDAARLLIDVRDQRMNQDQNGHESSGSTTATSSESSSAEPDAFSID